MRLTDTELVRLMQQGDRAACRGILDRHGPSIFNVAYTLVSRPEAVERVARAALRSAIDQIFAFDPQRHTLLPWLLRFVVQTAHQTPRPPAAETDGQRQDGDETDGDESDLDALDRSLEIGALSRAVPAAVAQLKPKDRVALVLRYHEGLSFADVALVLGMGEDTARRRVRQARLALATLLARQGSPGS